MAILDKGVYQSFVASRFPDNSSNLITPSNVRDMFNDTAESLTFLTTDMTVTSVWRFNGKLKTNAPSESDDVTTKSYVDQNVQGVSLWVESVIDFFDPTSALPVTPTTGDRHIASASANGWLIHNIYEYNGATWDETTATEGLATWNEAVDVFYTYNGAIWVQFGAVVGHNVLADLQGGGGGDFYHLNSTQYTGIIDKNANETIVGSFTFTSPVTGVAPTLDDHYVTKAYFEANPVSILAGSGLTKNGSNINLTGEITANVDNYFTSLEYKLRGVTNSLAVVLNDVGNAVFIGDGATTNLYSDYTSYIGLIAGVPSVKGDAVFDGGAAFTSTDPTKIFSLSFDNGLTQSNDLLIDIDGFDYVLDKTGPGARLSARQTYFIIGNDSGTYANYIRGTASYCEVFRESITSLSSYLRLTDTGGLFVDQISSIGLSYGADYVANGSLNDLWIPNWKAVKDYADSTGGTVTSVGGAGSINGLTLTGTVTTAGDLTLGGSLSVNNDDWSGTALTVPNGGTGGTTFTSEEILFGNGTGALSTATGFAYDVSLNTLSVPGKIIVAQSSIESELRLIKTFSGTAPDTASVTIAESTSANTEFGTADVKGFQFKYDGATNNFSLSGASEATVKTVFEVNRDNIDIEFKGAVAYQANMPTTDTVGRTLDQSDNNSIIRGNGTFTYTLSNSGLSAGWTTQVVNIGTGAVDFTSAQTINSEAGTTPSIDLQWTGVTIYYDGTSFTVIGAIS